MRTKAQASLEAVLSAVFTLVVLVFVIYNHFIMQESNSRLEEETLQKFECIKIAGVANSQLSFYHNSEVVLDIIRPFSVDGNNVIFQNYYCNAPLNLQRAFNAGKVKMKIENGVFDVYNV